MQKKEKKEKRRANGEGSISKILKNGKYIYRGALSIGSDEKGKLKRKYFFAKTKQEVVNKMSEYRTQFNNGSISVDGNITFQDWFYTYLFDFRIHDLKAGSFETYYSVYENHIKNNALGRKKLIDLRTIDFQKYINQVIATNEKTVNAAKTMNTKIGACLNEAVRQGYIPINYSKNVRFPKVAKIKDIKVLSLNEQNTFVEYLNNSNNEELKIMLLIALGTGLRLGELMGLKWRDISFTNKTLKVNRNLKRVLVIDRDGNKKAEYREQIPKTINSIREIPLTDKLINYLKEQKKIQSTNKLRAGDIYITTDYVFTDKIGKHIDKNKPARHFKKILKNLEIEDMKFHALRHTFATRLFEAGVQVKTVQSLMGHKDVQTTMNIYTHVMPDQKELALNALEHII